jgi:enterochelin esterase-like enzyme
MTTVDSHAPRTDSTGVTFSVGDEDEALEAVHLVQEIMRPRVGPPFSRPRGSQTWILRLRRPAADRMEYKFQLRHRDGREEVICDPGNPLAAPGPFGDKSVVEWPEYVPPVWLDASTEEGTRTELTISSRVLRNDLRVELWTPAARLEHEALPLIIALDGPEYDRFSSLTRFLAWAIDTQQLPPMRAALIPPVDRNETYSASASHSRALAHDILPTLAEHAPSPHGRKMRVGMGASLGALALLHVHRTNPASFGGLFLQSGSFFRQRFDRQETGFARFRRISRFVGKVAGSEEWAHPIVVTMTCGTAEENLYNNRHMRGTLASQGYEIDWVEHRDAHNWVSWRDTFDPHLTRFLQRLWS